MPIKAVFAQRGWLVAIAIIYLYAFPYFPGIQSANELPRIYLVEAMVDDHTFAIDRGVARWGATGDMSPSNGHLYSNKAPGSSLLAAPAYAAVRTLTEPSLAQVMWLCRLVTGIVPTLAFLWLLWGFLARFAPDPRVRQLVLVAYALGSLALPYSLLFYSHQLSAICIATAWILLIDVAERRRGLWAAAIAGGLAGAALLVDYQAAFAGLPIAIWLIARLWRTWPRRDLLHVVAAAAAAAAIPIAILLAYHAACFGSPLRTGYAASVTHAADHAAGLLGMTTPTWEALVGTTFGAQKGVFTLAPWLLLAVPGAVALWRRGQPGVALVGGANAVIFLWFIASLAFWRDSWEVGPRYITVMLPFLLPAVAAQLTAWRDRAGLLGAACATVVVAVVIHVLAVVTFPYWPPSARNPFYDVTLRLLADGAVAPSVASACGLDGVASVAPVLAAVAGLLGWSIIGVARWRGLAVAVVIGAGLLLGYRAFPSGMPDQKYHWVRDRVVDR